MTIPAYSPISDEEIAAGAALKESVVRRLRDNVGAVLGFDPLSSSPVPANANPRVNSIFTDLGTGELGDVVISSNTNIYSKMSQYRNLTINAGAVINQTDFPTGNEQAIGPRGLMIIKCTERFTLAGTIERYAARAPYGSRNGNASRMAGDVDPSRDIAYMLQTAKGLDGGANSGGGSLLIVCNEFDFQSTGIINCDGNNNYSDDGYGGVIMVMYRTLIANDGFASVGGGHGNNYYSHANGAYITLNIGAL